MKEEFSNEIKEEIEEEKRLERVASIHINKMLKELGVNDKPREPSGRNREPTVEIMVSGAKLKDKVDDNAKFKHLEAYHTHLSIDTEQIKNKEKMWSGVKQKRTRDYEVAINMNPGEGGFATHVDVAVKPREKSKRKMSRGTETETFLSMDYNKLS